MGIILIMDEKKLNKLVLISVAVVFIAAITIISVIFLVISRLPDSIRVDAPVREPGNAQQVIISPNAGGTVPTHVPTKTPQPIQGMESPLACKLVLAGIHTKARTVNASGIAVLNSYDPGKNACILDIKNDKGLGDLGRIEIFLEKTGEYGITVRIDAAKEDALRQWSEAALMFFNKAITVEEAETIVRQLLADGSADSPLYHIIVMDDQSIKDGNVSQVRTVQIINNTAAPESR